MNDKLAYTLQAIYDQEINVSISCFWDGGWDFKLGDEMNGWKAHEIFDDLEEGRLWLIEQVKKHYPKAEINQ